MLISMDLRIRVIQAYENKEGSIRSLGKRFCISPVTIWKWLKRYREEGTFQAYSPPGRAKKIDGKKLEILKSVVRRRNDATLDELTIEFFKRTGIEVSIMTIHRMCHKLGLRYKKNGISSRTETT